MGRVATQEELDSDDFVIPKTIGDPISNEDLLGEDDEEEDDEEVEPMLAALQEQMDTLKQSQGQEREFFQQLITQVAAGANQPAQQQQQQAQPEFNLDDLPDPVEDRAGFNKALAAAVTKFGKETAEQAAGAALTAATNNQSIESLQNSFRSQFPDLAKKSALFTAIVTQETNKIRNKGLDVKQFVFADQDKFLNTVAEAMRQELGIEDDDLDEDDEDDTRTVRKSVKTKSRAKGVRGGSSPKLKKSKSKGKKPTGFVAELKRQQQEIGIV